MMTRLWVPHIRIMSIDHVVFGMFGCNLSHFLPEVSKSRRKESSGDGRSFGSRRRPSSNGSADAARIYCFALVRYRNIVEIEKIQRLPTSNRPSSVAVAPICLIMSVRKSRSPAG